MKEKEKDVYKRTMEKYHVTLKYLRAYFDNKGKLSLAKKLKQQPYS